MARAPFLVRTALALVRLVSRLVPRADRDSWVREWEAEIAHEALPAAGDRTTSWQQQAVIGRRALGSIADATWLRRQFTGGDSELLHDVGYALRLYRRTPGTIAILVLVLAVGLGATTAVFSGVEATMLRPLPFADADRLVMVWQQTPETPKVDVAPGNFADWRDRARSFEILAAALPYSRDYTGGPEPEMFSGPQVTEGFFDVLRTQPQLGRLFDASDYASKRNVVVISDSLWRRRFGASPAIVGQPVILDGEPFEVVGVLPATYEPNLFDVNPDIFTPKLKIEDHERRTRGGGYWHAAGKLRQGVTIEEAQAELEAISRQLAAEYPRTNANVRAWAMPIRSHLANGAERPLALLGIGAVFIFVLAVGCVANLQLSLLVSRLQEFVLRTALGAGRPRLVRQVLAESALVTTLSVSLGIGLAWVTLSIVRSVGPATSSVVRLAEINAPVLIVAMGLGLVAAFLSALLPIVTILRSSGVSAGQGVLSVRSQAPALYGRSALVVMQIALALVLLVSAGLLGRSFYRLLSVDAGLIPNNLLGLQVFVYDRQTTAEKRLQFFADTIERIRVLPGVQSVGAASTVPFLQADIDMVSGMTIGGQEPARPEDQPRVYFAAATPDYFRTAGIALRRGRGFESTDTMQSAGVAVINETAARRFWPGADPIGSRIEVMDHGRKKAAEVVGVIADLRYGGLTGKSRPEVFLPFGQSPQASMTYVVRTGQDPAAAVNAVKRAVWSVDPLQTFYEAGAVTDMIDESLRPRLFVLRLALCFAGVGFLLAIAGAYGAVAWSLRRRTSEFGVRMALGASGATIRRHMLGYAARLATIGIAIGIVCALLLGELLGAFLFELSATDPLTLVAISAVLMVAVLAAAAVPARRASKIDPVIALRS